MEGKSSGRTGLLYYTCLITNIPIVYYSIRSLKSFFFRGDVRFKSGEHMLLGLCRNTKQRPGSDHQNKTITTKEISTCREAASVMFVYHGLYTCTRPFHGRYMHRAGLRTMGQIRCLEGFDLASKWYNEKQRETILGFEMISLTSCHMT